MRKLNKIMLGMLLGSGMLASGVANAAAYAVSMNNINAFGLTFIGGPVQFNGFTFSNDFAVSNGTGAANAAFNGADAPASCIGCGYNNAFASHGAGSEYAYGDALIGNTNVTGGVGAAAGIAETSAFNGGGAASSTNTMIASFTLFGPTSVGYSFQATPYLNALLTSGGLASSANLSMGITIYNAGGAPVFNWSPNGAAGGIVGGTESADAFSLNQGIAQNAIFNPGMGNFSATSSSLAAGSYQMNISMNESTSVSAVPLPAAVWLLGSGLVGLAGVARARRKSI